MKRNTKRLRELYKQRKSDLPKLINPVPNPRYDEVYHDGVNWLESLYSVDEIIRLGINKESERLKSLQNIDNMDRVTMSFRSEREIEIINAIRR